MSLSASLTRTVSHAKDLLRLWSLTVVVAGLACGASTLAAQGTSGGLPSPAQAQQLLQNPAMVQQLRQKLEASGLTPDEIRARLRAAGYPEGMLDQYLPGGGGASGGGMSGDSTLSPDQLDAISQLGLVDSTEADSMLGTGGIDSIARNGALGIRNRGVRADTSDSAFYDAYYRAYYDSVAKAQAALRARPQLTDPYVYDSLADSASMARQDSMFARTGTGSVLSAVAASRRGLVTDTFLVNQINRRRILKPPLPQTLQIFGLNLFRERGRSTFQPNLAGPVDRNYKLEPGDKIVLIITGDVERAVALPVTREGFIVIPQIGQLGVANLTLEQLDNLLYERLSKAYSGVKRGPGATTHFSVSISHLHSNQVYVVGDVTEPGSYQISSAGTALTAVYAAGGPTMNGSLRHVLVKRGGLTVDSLDVYDYLLKGDATHDVRLQDGDIVFVSTHGPQIKVAGEVVRPSIYELLPNETLRDVLRDAGGFKAEASRRRVQIYRILPPDARSPSGGRDRVVIDVASEQLETGDAPALAMAAGDSVQVFGIAPRVRDRISVSGDVWTPGIQGFAAGMRLSDALKLAGGPRPDAYLGQVLIARMQPDSTRVQMRASLRDSAGTPVDDIFLKEDDDIRIFSLRDFRPRRYVQIAGAVRKAGRFQYHDGMTVRDLVLLSGGLTEGASLQEAEIAHLPENRAGGTIATTVRVPLDSTYLFERTGPGKYLGPPGQQGPVDPGPDIPLQPYDNVLILRQPDFELLRTVVVTGQVKFPGRYTLLKRDERLDDILRRAGGVTANAYAEGTIVYRTRDRVGRIGVDVPTVLKNSGSRDNLILQDGDSLMVPVYSGIVRVSGAVNSPVALAYVHGQDINYYIRAAGGGSRKADEDRAFVTQPNGKVEAIHHHFLLPSSLPKPRAGSEVYVPEKEFKPEESSLPVFALIAQMVAALATVIVVSHR